MATSDDAGVYRISDELALIQTLDFFTPIVDDPYDFGRIAAANALSDIYAMGGIPKTAMNIVAYPMGSMGPGPLREMLAGGAATLREADTVLLGGHSVEDEEMKYGLSVTGFVHPKRIIANQGLFVGDCLVLTKPLGTGIINTAIKGGLVPYETIRRVTELMATLNRVLSAGLPISPGPKLLKSIRQSIVTQFRQRLRQDFPGSSKAASGSAVQTAPGSFSAARSSNRGD